MPDTIIQLEREIYKNDALRIASWLEDENITKYLNESKNITGKIHYTVQYSNLPILTHLFNRDGVFFLIKLNNSGPIGFLRLVKKEAAAEMIIVIGEKEKWGLGYGYKAVIKGLRYAFFNWHCEKVTAKININNERSIRIFRKAGFSPYNQTTARIDLSISMDQFLKQ